MWRKYIPYYGGKIEITEMFANPVKSELLPEYKGWILYDWNMERHYDDVVAWHARYKNPDRHYTLSFDYIGELDYVNKMIREHIDKLERANDRNGENGE